MKKRGREVYERATRSETRGFAQGNPSSVSRLTSYHVRYPTLLTARIQQTSRVRVSPAAFLRSLV